MGHVLVMQCTAQEEKIIEIKESSVFGTRGFGFEERDLNEGSNCCFRIGSKPFTS